MTDMKCRAGIHVGAVNFLLNGCIQVASPLRTIRFKRALGMRPPNAAGRARAR